MPQPTTNTIFIDFLRELRVPFTPEYSQKRFDNMPFQSLFGMSKLLGEYGVESRGIQLADPSQIASVPLPFIARTGKGLVIVTAIDDGERIDYLSQGLPESMPLADFVKIWSGTAFQAFPSPQSRETDYSLHRRSIFFSQVKKILLRICLLLLFLYLFIVNGLCFRIADILLVALSIGGLYFSTLLLQKSLKIHNPHADRVCGVIQEGGCDKVLETKGSTFFGIFSWSEVGFAYFSVSLLTMLMAPVYMPLLALINLCCLPFSFWSVWYQKTRARHWCTLCLCVQATLWALFFCFLGGGYLSTLFGSRFTAGSLLSLIFLLCVYGAVLLGLNGLTSFFKCKTSENISEDEP